MKGLRMVILIVIVGQFLIETQQGQAKNESLKILSRWEMKFLQGGADVLYNEVEVIKLSMEEMKSISGNSGFISRLDTNNMREIEGGLDDACWKLDTMCGLRTCSSSPCSYCDGTSANRNCNIPAPNKTCIPDSDPEGCGSKWINATCDGGYCSGGQLSEDYCPRMTATGSSCS